MSERDDALVLADSEGNYYLLPREMIELTKVEPAAVDALSEHIDSDVSGYSALGSGFSFVGFVRLAPEQTFSQFSSAPAWPYVKPGGGAPDLGER